MVCPFHVEVIEDGIGNAVTASGVLETVHDLQSSSDFAEASFDDIGGTDHLAQFPGKLKERDQLVEVFLKATDGFGDLLLPSPPPSPKLTGSFG